MRKSGVPSLVFVFLLLFSSLVLLIPDIQQAHAVTPTLTGQTGKNITGATSYTMTCPSISAGTYLVIVDIQSYLSGGSSPTFTVSDPSGTYTGVNFQTANLGGYYMATEVFYEYSTCVNPSVVTVTVSSSSLNLLIGAGWFSGTSGWVAANTQVGSGNSGTPQATGSSTFPSTYGIAIATDVLLGTCHSACPPTGFTAYTGMSANCLSASFGCDAYDISNTGSTNYGAGTSASNPWLINGVMFGPGTTSPPYGFNCSSAASCTPSQGFNDTANSAIVIAVEWSNNLAPTTSVISVSDTLGNSFTLRTSIYACSDINTCANGNVVYSAIWTATATVIGSNDKVTVSTSTGTFGTIGVELYDVSGVSAIPACTGAGAAASSNTLYTVNGCSISSGQTAIAALGGLAANTLTAGTNYALTGSGLVNMQAESSTTVASTNLFPATISAATAVSDVGIVLAPSTGGTTTIGSCPAKNTATTALVNNTVYLWGGSGLAGETINNLQIQVASSNPSGVATEPLILGVYEMSASASPSPGVWPILSATYPYQLVAQKLFVLTAGRYTTSGNLNWAPGVGIQGQGQPFAIAVLGNNKISINNSALSGMTTASYGGAGLPTTISSTSASATELFFCGSLSFQTVLTTTVVSVSTTTSTVTTNGGFTTTISTTTTLTSLSANAALGNSVGVAFLLLILLAPAFALAIPLGVYTRSAIGAGLGFVSGLAIGALLGNQGGLIPFSVLAGLMVVIVLLIVGFIFALKGGNG